MRVKRFASLWKTTYLLLTEFEQLHMAWFIIIQMYSEDLFFQKSGASTDKPKKALRSHMSKQQNEFWLCSRTKSSRGKFWIQISETQVCCLEKPYNIKELQDAMFCRGA